MNPRALVAAALLLASLAAARAAEYHVAPAGDDANPGTMGKPFATLQAAVNRLQPGDTLFIRGGVYRETVTFPRSGAEGMPITLKPYREEKAVVTGCDPVTGWVRQEGDVWKAPMPWTLGAGRNQVFFDGAVMVEARHPNVPAPGLEMYVAGLSPLWPTYGEFSIPKETRVKRPGRIVSKLLEGQPDDCWKGAIYCGVHFEGWCTQTGVIEGSRSGEIEVGDRTQGWWFGSAYDGKFPQEHEAGRGMIVGHRRALDAPGEWHWEDGALYLIAPGGAEPRAVEAKRRQLAFDLSGREHIRIEGLVIRAASMRLEGSAHCTVDRCDLSHISHYTRHYGIGQIEKGRDTIRSGETGIFVGGHDNAFLNCGVRFSAGAGFHLRGHHHTIHNCLIDEVSYVGHYLNAITDAVTDFPDYENFLVGGHVITFNTMRNANRHFFNFYGNGTSTASRDRGPMDYAATLFAHNHLYNGMLLTRDAGFLSGYFCSGGTLNGQHSQVAYNVLHDCYDISAMRWNKLGLIYLDEGTCDVDVHHNLLWAAPGSNQRDMWFNTCCVDIREHDNRFHGLFTRTCAELRDEDFPGGQPFRFGHDFAHPPVLPKWPQIVSRRLDAAGCSSRSDGVAVAPAGLTGLEDGAWFAHDGVDLGSGWGSAILRFASDVKALNADRSARSVPRHRNATDPLVLEAKYNDGAHEKLRKQWTFLYNIEDGAWVRFDRVPLGDGYRRFRTVYGNDAAEPWRMEIRLDRADGPLAGQVALPQTDRARGGHVQIYREGVADLSADARGTRDVFLVFRSESARPVVDFEYLRFEQYRGELPLQKNEVRIELRSGGKDGPKMGQFFPRFTGGAPREFVAPLEPAGAQGQLFFVVRSAIAGSIGTVEGIRLEKAADPIDGSGVGVPPRRAWWGWGDWVFPEPTNLPRARPADRYREQKAGRPFFRVARVASRPSIDGALDEWKGRALELAQTLEGATPEGSVVRAWVGVDDEALYVALCHPVRDAKAVVAEGHRWGATDGVEIALQDTEARPAGPILSLRGWPDGHFCAPDLAGVTETARRRLEKGVSYSAAVGTDAWACEWRIPFGACGFAPRTPATLACNLTVRNVAEEAWRTWSADGGATYDPHNGGTLILGACEALLSGELRKALEVWFDASDIATIEKDAGGRVSAWKDKSGKGRHAAQAADEFSPLYDPRGLGGKAALKFDDVRRTRLDVPEISDRPIAATVFAVVSNPEPGLPNNHNQRIFTTSDGKGYDYLCGLCCSIPGTQTGGPRLLVHEGRDRWAKSVRVGCFSPNYQTFFKGNISEILVFGRALTSDERHRVSAYLAGKWEL